MVALYAGSIREPLDVTSRRRMATAVPIGTFNAHYAGECLTVSKNSHRTVKLSSLAPAASASGVCFLMSLLAPLRHADGL
jgi:hypothetical protein